MPITTTAADIAYAYPVTSGSQGEDVLGAPGGVYEVFIANNGASARWILFFDSLTRPADTTTSPHTVRVGAGEQIRYPIHRFYATGFTWAVSSTGDQLTYDAAGSMAVGLWYGRSTV